MKKSFTLIEILISIGIFAIILAAVFVVFHVGRTSFHMNSIKVELSQKTREAMKYMEKELLQTRISRVSIPSSDTIVFQIPTGIDGSGTITWSSTITYALSGNQIIRTQDAQQRVVTGASYVDDVQFAFPSDQPGMLSIYLKASRSTPDSLDLEAVLSVYIKMRN